MVERVACVRVAVVLMVVAIGLFAFGAVVQAAPATNAVVAQDVRAQDTSQLRLVVVEINGLIDHVVAAYLREQIAAVNGTGTASNAVNGTGTAAGTDTGDTYAAVIAVQLDSAGTTLDDTEMAKLLTDLTASAVPVGVWVGPSGAAASGGAAHLVDVAKFSALAPGSTVGGRSDLTHVYARALSPTSVVLRADEAVEQGVAKAVVPSIGEFLLALSDAGIVPPIATEVTSENGELVQRTLSAEVSVVFTQPALLDSLFHTAASTAIAYLLLLIGLSMLLLDFFTGGVGVAGVVGVGALLLSAYGLGELDIRIWALVALVAAFVAVAVDLQTGIPRFWTVVGCLLLLVGSLFLFGRHSLNWLPLITGLGLAGAFMLAGMPALIRTRYGTTTVGRQWLIGSVGVAVTGIDPEGVLEIGSAHWRARSSRLLPLRQGEMARVTGLAGVVLEVEPQFGAPQPDADEGVCL